MLLLYSQSKESKDNVFRCHLIVEMLLLNRLNVSDMFGQGTLKPGGVVCSPKTAVWNVGQVAVRETGILESIRRSQAKMGRGQTPGLCKGFWNFCKNARL